MDFFGSFNDMEQYLRKKCADTLTPFAGGFELTPECNMDCKFCYVHQNHNNRKEAGELLSAEQWCSIVDQAYDNGMYSVLITGGEPLLHPGFRQIYAHIAEKGIPIVLNSNGTLMNEDIIDFIKQSGCRRMNISLYGSNNETYEKLCGLRNGFDKVMHTLQFLKANNMTVRISVSLTPQNINQMDEINRIADELDFPVQFTSYMFPGSRRGISSREQYRLSPKEAAAASIKCFHLQNPTADYEASCRLSLLRMNNPSKYNSNRPGFTCYGGKSDFWVSWNGEMRPCGMFSNPDLACSLLEFSFAECWEKMTFSTQSCACVNDECRKCRKRDLCQVCPAASYAETGKMNGKPEYLCEMTDEIVQICRDSIAESRYTSPLVSVIVPVYNVEKYLQRCVDSILCQTLHALEVILVDDGSSDRSGEICDQYQQKDSRVKVIHQNNKGVSAARNAGLELSSAPWIMFCDSDDFVEADFCRVLYHRIKERKDSFIVANTWTGREECPREFIIGVNYHDPVHITTEEIRHNATFAYVWNKIYSKDIITNHNLRFDESCSYGEDLRFNNDYIVYCKDASFITTPLCVHLNHPGGLADQGLQRSGEDWKERVDPKVLAGIRLEKR